MTNNKNRRKELCIIISFIIASLTILPFGAEAFSDQVIQKGATGDDVIELQARLQYNGFYDGEINGVFGWSTYWAVRNFQEEFELEVADGLVGEKTKEMLERATDYDKEWVHRMIREGRKFTYYGGTPKEIQKGPKGSRDSKQTDQKEQDQQRNQGEEPAQEPGQPTEQPGQGEQPAPEQGTEGGQGEQPVPEQGAEGGQGEQPAPEQGAEGGQGEQLTPEQGTEGGQEEQPAPEQGAEGGQGEQPTPEQGTEGGQEEQPAPDQEEEEGGDPTPEEEPVGQEDDDVDVESAINVPEGFSDNDIQLLSQAVHGEARGEPYAGQVAVAAVILSRVNSPKFPNSISGVIFEPRAFTAVADGQIYLEPNETSRKAALDAINGQDPSGGALYFFNPDTATSAWIWSRPQIKQIGKHIFCK
ncbi:cell wall hydrolase [Bacillus alkalicola]|uniref:Cell wall hydrolase n=1 Tax=Evansella alkalicola TaxID=745819 RepID=A0ABS6K1Y1_9BACI|nr:cell wall hydrolase [Bacillus alkalicola]MBU9723974.1 cell wall hydrolase [Bacillus alkalicola]